MLSQSNHKEESKSLVLMVVSQTLMWVKLKPFYYSQAAGSSVGGQLLGGLGSLMEQCVA